MSNRADHVALVAACLVACGGAGTAPPPYVAQPAPDCTPLLTPPQISSAAVVAGPAQDPGACLQPVVASALPPAQALHLGVLAANAEATFEVPAGTGSFTVVEQAVVASSADVQFAGSPLLHNVAVPLRLVDPAGRLYYDDAGPVPADFSKAAAIYLGGRAGTGAFTVPGTSRALAEMARGVPAGAWKVTVGDYAAECALLGSPACTAGADLGGRYDVTILLRPGPVPSTGTLDVSFYLVTGRFTAAGAPADAGLVRLLATLRGVLAGAGLCLGKVTFVDVPDWVRARHAAGVDVGDGGPCSGPAQLATLSRAENALPIFLVDDILVAGTSGLRTVGLDGAIPGPSSFGGTTASGALVNAADVGQGTCPAGPDYARCGSDAAAAVVAHEAGHWLGLYHTTERSGRLFDPLDDSGTCRCDTCAPAAQRAACGTSTTIVTAADCGGGGCAGADNLMFWLLGGDRLTPQQAQVARANPAIH